MTTNRNASRSGSIWAWFRKAIVRTVIGYGVIILVLALLQRKLMYHPMVADQIRPPIVDGHVVEPIETTTEDGITLHGWYWRAVGRDVNRPVVVLFHGNAGNRTHRSYDCELFSKCGCDTVLFDYRGYGENAGNPTEDGLTLDARAIWNFTTSELDISPNRIILFGASLGGGVSVRLAAEQSAAGNPPAGLMLRCTFLSMVDAASYNYPWLPVKWVLVDRYPSDQHAPDVACPVLQMHGNADSLVPFESGQNLFHVFPEQATCGQEKRFVELDGATHQGILRTHYPEVLASTRRFINDITANKQSASE